ncbi:bifunctional [glutamate--ammonia ligase]-adenylyl-L-tyrosine phosphorylase/[glutamate--ammonia-ligase] adenylyltransferase [Halofilum ochraceum]|uniref:bifunctional [glutamate--ammonia ligase]-adenylyl-L-tyrosine phosphorylase/[glutamate--ammonia-ligase] adenylyltransferase n=1 Tax=Halofilum ochraceum TaxID=1611323 RepID=UPI0009F6E1AF|nr:bifunctional [glutamate--ammonia ligase]-adenylyl-L-tyrosine phosphorylase/[glutamate--ammonia-ligase] adenylyltransferase [Halofilum ochraceum]
MSPDPDRLSSNPLLRPPPAPVANAGERAFDAVAAAASVRDAGVPTDEPWCDTARAVFGASEFVARVAERQPAAFAELAAAGMPAPGDADALARRLEETVAATLIDAEDEPGLMRALRRFRALESARIAWRDLTGQATIDATLAAQSALADACIRVTLARLEVWAQARHGVPRDAAGQPQSLVVLGMGKLGGGELNFSSDIDLILLYGEPGTTDGDRPLEHDAYFMRLGQRLIRILDERTADGYVFRVDMRLRPFGTSGPLVMHTAQLEQYLLTQAREWERFALVKARPISGDQVSVQAVEELLRPFVFRRYLDFGAFESLRDLKARLEREMARKGLHGNVKYGRGGIREIEFVAQAFQLIRGGREPRLRQRSLLGILGALDQLGELPSEVIADLAAAYRFLRRVENRLQARADERVHALPRDPDGRAWLAWVLGLEDEADLKRELDHHTGRVQACFNEVFNLPGPEGEGADDGVDAGLGPVWEAELAEDEAEAVLAQAGFSEPADVRRRLTTLQQSSRFRTLSATARARLDTLMPLLLADVAAVAANGRTLGRLLALIEAVARRSVYLSLLAENAAARRRLVELCAASAWIADFVTRHPILLDELIDPDSLYEPLDRAAVAAEIEEALVGVDSDDLEAQMDALRRVRQTNVLRVAAVDITGRLPLMRVSDYLTWIAEAVLEAVHRLVYNQTVARYGRPRSRLDGVEREPAFGIVAYGKLGGIELGYGSDLDLVFLYDAEGEDLGTDGERELDNATFFARLAQRIIHFLNTPTPAGVLYEIDTRLRPNGSAGMLVSTLDAFTRYQHENAWTWEHQALVRARMVVGDETLATRFETVRAEVLQRPRDPDTLRDEVVSMRERMRRELARGGRDRFDLKQDRGGVADIEFMVQYGVLAGACATPALAEYTDNIRLIEALAAHDHLDADEARLLADAYRGFRTRIHRLALLDEPAVVEPDDELAAYVDTIAALWERRMGGAVNEQ